MTISRIFSILLALASTSLLSSSLASCGFGKKVNDFVQSQWGSTDTTQEEMSVTLEISIEHLVKKFAGTKQGDENFQKSIDRAREIKVEQNTDFITAFERAFNEVNPEGKMATVFSNYEYNEKFPRNASNDEIISILKKEAQDAVNKSENIIHNRINRFGIKKSTIQHQQHTDRILIELSGVADQDRVKNLLQSTGFFEILETYENHELADLFHEANNILRNEMGNENEFPIFGDSSLIKPAVIHHDGERYLSEGPRVGFVHFSDTAQVNKILKLDYIVEFFPENLRLLWGINPETNGFIPLYATKTGTETEHLLTGKNIVDVRQGFNPLNDVEVNMQMNSAGASIWKNMSKKNIGKPIAIVIDDRVYNAPIVQTEIANGRVGIHIGQATEEHVNRGLDLANIIKSGYHPTPVNIID